MISIIKYLGYLKKMLVPNEDQKANEKAPMSVWKVSNAKRIPSLVPKNVISAKWRPMGRPLRRLSFLIPVQNKKTKE